LIERGYRLERDDLYLETWTDLIKVENAIASAVRKKSKPSKIPPKSTDMRPPKHARRK
jgi:hypothetical protein